ncbi:MAG: hypothetical protein IJD65_05780 [Mailhella sp.]|nr:hypothetical protein [Mailhella sp.]
MSQINGFANVPQSGNVGGTEPQAALSNEAKAALKSRITEEVRQFEVLPYQARRAERTNAQQAGYVIGRVVGAVLTLGVSEGIIAIGHKAEQLNARNLREQAVSRLTHAAHANEAVGRAVLSGEGFPTPAYKAAVEEAVRDLKAAFGEQLSEVSGFSDLPSSLRIARAVKSELARLADTATAGELKAIVMQKALPFVREQALLSEMSRSFAAAGYGESPADKKPALMDRLPELKEALSHCGDSASVAEVLDRFRAGIDAFTAQNKAFDDALAAGMEHAENLLAQQFGISREDVRRNIPLTKLDTALVPLAMEMLVDADPPATAEQVLAACKAKAEEFVAAKLHVLEKVDELNIPDALKTAWKNQTLSNTEITKPDQFIKAAAAAGDAKVQRSMARLIALSGQGEQPEADMLYASMQSLCLNVRSALVRQYGGEDAWFRLGGDGQNAVFRHSLKALFASEPRLGAALGQMQELLQDAEARADDEAASMDRLMSETAGHMRHLAAASREPGNDENIIRAVEAGTPPPLFLAAQRSMEAEVRAAFANTELPADLMGMNRGDTNMAGLMGKLMRNAEGPLTPEAFARMLRPQLFLAATHTAAAVLISAEAEHRGVPISREACEGIAAHLSLAAALGNAGNELEVLQALADSKPALDALLDKAQLPIANANAHAAAFQNAVDALAANLGLSAGDVRVRLANQLAELETSLGQLESVIKGVAQPDLARIPGLYAERVEPFVQNITAAFYAVDELGISPELKAEWKGRVLSDPAMADASLLKHAAKLGADLASQYGVGPLARNIGDAEGFYTALRSLPAGMGRMAQFSVPTQEWSRLGAEGQKALYGLALLAQLDSEPGLIQKIRENPGMLQAAGELAGADILANMDDSDPQQLAAGVAAVRAAELLDALMGPVVSNAELAAGLEKPEALPAAYLQAFRQAEVGVRARFSGLMLPEDFMAVQLADGTKVGEALIEAVRNGEGTLSPEAFAAKVEAAFRPAVADALLHDDLLTLKAQGMGSEELATLCDIMSKRIFREPSVKDPLAFLSSVRQEFGEVVRMFSDADRAIGEAAGRVFAELAGATGLSVRQLQESGYGRQIRELIASEKGRLTDIAADPEIPAENFPEALAIEDIFSRGARRPDVRDVVDACVREFAAARNAVDALRVSPELAAALKSELLADAVLRQPGFLRKCADTTRMTNASSFAGLMADPDAKDEDRYLVLNWLARQYNKALYGGEGRIFSEAEVASQDDRARIMRSTMKMLLDLYPGLRGAGDLHDFHEAVLRLEQRLFEEMDRVTAQENRLSAEEARRQFSDVHLEHYFMEQLLLNMHRAVVEARTTQSQQ